MQRSENGHKPHLIRVAPPGAGGGGYVVTVRAGHIGRLAESWPPPPGRKMAVVTDSVVGPLYGPTVERSLRGTGSEPVTVTVPAGEEHKTLDTVTAILDQLLRAGVERSTPVL